MLMPPSQLFPHAPHNEGRLSLILVGGVQQLRVLLVKSVEVLVVLRDQVTSESMIHGSSGKRITGFIQDGPANVWILHARVQVSFAWRTSHRRIGEHHYTVRITDRHGWFNSRWLWSVDLDAAGGSSLERSSTICLLVMAFLGAVVFSSPPVVCNVVFPRVKPLLSEHLACTAVPVVLDLIIGSARKPGGYQRPSVKEWGRMMRSSSSGSIFPRLMPGLR